MNDCKFSGTLHEDADVRTTPSGDQVVTFVLINWSEGDADPVFLAMRMENPFLIRKQGALLTKGRLVYVTRCKAGKMYRTRGVSGIVGESVEFLVYELEVPNRSKPEADAPAERPERKKEAAVA